MRILFLGGSFLENKGGIERYNHTMVNHLTELKHTVTAFSVNDKGNSPIVGFNRNWVKLFAHTFISAYRTDVFLIGHRNFLPLLFLPGFWFKSKILIAHGIEVWHPQKTLIRFAAKFLTSIWPVSFYTQEQVKSNLSSKIKCNVIPNTLPPGFTTTTTENIENKQREFAQVRFLSVSRVMKAENYKNIDLCILAILKWAETTSLDWTYDLVIHGDDKEKHVRLASENTQITIHGHVSDEILKDLYLKATHFLLPSTGEGFGIVYLEAMANGCICIGADTGGITDIIKHGENGFLSSVPVNQSNLLSLINLSLEKENRLILALNGRESVNRFSFETVNSKIALALNPLMGD